MSIYAPHTEKPTNVRPAVYGQWLEVTVEDMGNMLVASMRCDQCNKFHNEVYHYGDPTEMAHFCPFCGADMRQGRKHKAGGRSQSRELKALKMACRWLEQSGSCKRGPGYLCDKDFTKEGTCARCLKNYMLRCANKEEGKKT